MTPVPVAAFSAIANLLIAAAAGLLAGWLMSLLFRLGWRSRDVFLDASLGACMALVCVFVVSTYNALQKALPTGMPLMLGGGVLGVIIRHAIRLMLRTMTHGRT